MCSFRELEAQQRTLISDLRAVLLVVLRLENGQDVVKDFKDTFQIDQSGKIAFGRDFAALLRKTYDYFHFHRLENLRNKGHLKDRSPMRDFNLKHWRMVHR